MPESDDNNDQGAFIRDLISELKISDLIKECHRNAREHGFWEKPREFGTLIALCHSELSEALEGHRSGDMENVTEELADCVIRIFDLAGGLDLDLPKAMLDKMRKNRKRPHKHGRAY